MHRKKLRFYDGESHWEIKNQHDTPHVPTGTKAPPLIVDGSVILPAPTPEIEAEMQ